MTRKGISVSAILSSKFHHHKNTAHVLRIRTRLVTDNTLPWSNGQGGEHFFTDSRTEVLGYVLAPQNRPFLLLRDAFG